MKMAKIALIVPHRKSSILQARHNIQQLKKMLLSISIQMCVFLKHDTCFGTAESLLVFLKLRLCRLFKWSILLSGKIPWESNQSSDCTLMPDG